MINQNLKIYILAISISAFSHCVFAGSDNGIIKVKSHYSVAKTIDRLESVLKEKGMTIFKRVDHTEGAKNVDMTLRPTQLLIFGNPKVGTPLMLCSQTAALDLPQKALAYKDESGQVWLAYNDPAYMAKRHQIKNCDKALNKVSKALTIFIKSAAE